MTELIDREATLKKMCETCGYCERFEKAMRSTHPDFVSDKCNNYKFLAEQPTIEAESVRRGRWIECDYKHMEHDMIETEPKAGLCCSECRTAFQKKKMTYKQYCAACGARMDADRIADASKKYEVEKQEV